mgnify:CR=1 FL=1
MSAAWIAQLDLLIRSRTPILWIRQQELVQQFSTFADPGAVRAGPAGAADGRSRAVRAQGRRTGPRRFWRARHAPARR